MNDPHVTALVYVVEHDGSSDYSRAETVEIEHKAFRLRLEDGEARFELKEHVPTRQQAQQVVQPFIRQWELSASFERGPGTFTLKFERDEIIDRNPTLGVILVSANPASFEFSVSTPKVTVIRQYPQPPPDRQMDIDNPDVRSMLHRYIGYRQGRETLPSMAYFCYSVFTGGQTRNAPFVAKKHKISKKMLSDVRMLASTKGGHAARKKTGTNQVLDQGETRFLEKAVAAMITRAAMVAADPNQPMDPIDKGNVLEISP